MAASMEAAISKRGTPFRYVTAFLGALLAGWTAGPSAVLANEGAIVEVFTSASGTFTIVTTLPSGLSCLVAAGDNWENLPARLTGTMM